MTTIADPRYPPRHPKRPNGLPDMRPEVVSWHEARLRAWTREVEHAALRRPMGRPGTATRPPAGRFKKMTGRLPGGRTENKPRTVLNAAGFPSTTSAAHAADAKRRAEAKARLAELERIDAERAAERARAQDRLVAFHEAGHAVAALLTGFGFDRVEIERGGGGALYHERATKPPAVVTLAGMAAVGREGGRAVSGAAQDMAQAREWCEANRPYNPDGSRRSAEDTMASASRAARELVDQEWNAIQAVARRLLSSRSLSYQEASRIALDFLSPPVRAALAGRRADAI